MTAQEELDKYGNIIIRTGRLFAPGDVVVFGGLREGILGKAVITKPSTPAAYIERWRSEYTHAELILATVGHLFYEAVAE